MTQNIYTLLRVLFLTIPFTISAQVTLEMTYPTTDLHRVNWIFGGEKYWYADDSLKEIKVFSEQHQLEKTIPYPSVANAQVRLMQGDYGVTQTTINPDNLLEMVWLVRDTATKQEKLLIKNELDSVLFRYETPFESVSFSEIEGLEGKMFVAELEQGIGRYITKVYSLPAFRLENIYFMARYLYRKKFAYAGEKYFYKDVEMKMMHIYNSNHSFWKNVNLAWFPNIILNDYDEYLDADDNINPKDSLVEVSFRYETSNSFNNIILSENGRRYRPDKISFNIHKKKNLNNRILEIDWSSTVITKYRYITLSDFLPKIEFESNRPINRFYSNIYNELMVTYSQRLTVYYNNNRNSRILSIPLNNEYSPYNLYDFWSRDELFDISSEIINRDSLFEMLYVEKKFSNEEYHIVACNDTGKIYRTIDSTRFFKINEAKNLPPKLITKTGNDKPYNTKVWRLGGEPTPIKETPSVFEVKIYPNPARDEMIVELPENTEGVSYNIAVYNMLGQNVYTSKTLSKSYILKKEHIGRGGFIVKISNSQKSISKTVVFD